MVNWMPRKPQKMSSSPVDLNPLSIQYSALMVNDFNGTHAGRQVFYIWIMIHEQQRKNPKQRSVIFPSSSFSEIYYIKYVEMSAQRTRSRRMNQVTGCLCTLYNWSCTTHNATMAPWWPPNLQEPPTAPLDVACHSSQLLLASQKKKGFACPAFRTNCH